MNDLCSIISLKASLPYADSTVINGVRFYSTRFDTRAYPVFTILHNIFIINGKKIISPDLFHYLSPVALAYWIMGDGARKQKGLLLLMTGLVSRR